MQPGDALTDGETYYWRVRASDPDGAAAWSGWSAARAFTVDTSANLPTWFQTAQGQFWQDGRFGRDGSYHLSAAVAGDQVVTAKTETFAVNHSKYDAFDDNSTYDYQTAALCLGYDVTYGNAVAGFRAPRVTFREEPYLDWVEDAYLLLTNAAASATTVNLKLYADDQLTSPDFELESNKPSNRTATSAQVDWDVTDGWGLAGALIRSPSLRDVVQEIVSLEGWDGDNNPNPLTVLIANDGGANNRQVQAYDAGSAVAAWLVVTAQDRDTVGNLYSPPIVLADTFGSGTWGQVFWTAETPGASSVYLQVLYVNASGEIAPLPAGDLPGNDSDGFFPGNTFKQTGFVDLSGLSTTTYGTLILKARLNWGDDGPDRDAPTFLEWGLTQGDSGPSDTTVTRQITTDAGAVYSFGTAGLTARFDDPPDAACNLTVHVYRNQEYNDDDTIIDRYWDVTTDCAADTYEAVLNLSYSQAEYAGCTDVQCPAETALRYKHWNGSSWDVDDPAVGVAAAWDADANLVTVTHVKRFSPITLGGGDPTAVELVSFAATAQGNEVRVTWETASEIDTLGFNLYRAADPTGEWTRLNAELIPGQAPGSPVGAVYEWWDTETQPGVTYYYELAVIGIDHTIRYGPVSATMPAGSQFCIYLPLVARER